MTRYAHKLNGKTGIIELVESPTGSLVTFVAAEAAVAAADQRARADSAAEIAELRRENNILKIAQGTLDEVCKAVGWPEDWEAYWKATPNGYKCSVGVPEWTRDLLAELRAKVEALPGSHSFHAVLVSHMDLPAYVKWSKNGYYLKLRDGSYRYVCGLAEIESPTMARIAALAAKGGQQ